MSDFFEEIERQVLENFNATYEQCIDMLASATEKWSSDSSTDLLARGIIGTMRPLLDSLHGDPRFAKLLATAGLAQ